MRLSLLTLAIAGLLVTLPASADTLTYNGHLEASNAPANGRFDLRLVTHGDAKSAAPLAAPMEFPSVPVIDGAFRVEFDLPAGRDEAWVELAVRAAGESVWSTIPGRNKAVAAPSAIGQCWSSTGDDGSNPATNFLGTTDAQPLVLRTRNVQSFKIEPSTELFEGNPITANVIAGSSANVVTAGMRGATISGGGMPSSDSDPITTVGGKNLVADHYGTVAGGFNNRAGNVNGAYAAAVGGGHSNVASGQSSTISGGSSNTAIGFQSTVGGGNFNFATGQASAVSGGFFNTASGLYSTVSGGTDNCAGGRQSWAGGSSAKVRPGSSSGVSGSGCLGIASTGVTGDVGTYVWADSEGNDFVSTGSDQFNVRARGGVGINMTPRNANVELTLRGRESDAFGGNADVQLIVNNANLEGVQFSVSDGGSGTNDANFEIAHANGTGYAPRMSLLGTGAVTIRSNATGTNTGVTMAAGAGAWSSLSDRNVKTGVVAVNAMDVLARVSELPLSTWSYIAQGEGIRHMGPMAQDFRAAFGLGESDTSISTIDADGVALAAIQGLHATLEAKQTEIDAMRLRIDELERMVRGLVAEPRQ